MRLYKIALSAFAGALAGEVLGPHIKDGYNWVRGKLDLPAVSGRVTGGALEALQRASGMVRGKPADASKDAVQAPHEPPSDVN